MASKAISQYLERYAEPVPEFQAANELGPFDEVVVVPCYGENEIVDGLLDSLDIAAGEKQVLVLPVVNESATSPLPHRYANQALLNRMDGIHLHGGLTVVPVDRAGENAFAPRMGVGLARKTGADLALALHHSGTVHSPWIHTTDADARVAEDYFDLTPASGVPWGLGPLAAGAFVHPFRHDLDGALGEALEAYDSYLRYYSERLAYAGSPFAYPTIGSTISFSAEAYAQVRGFPKKEAGEDFYFLHKLAKVAFIWPGGGEVELICRPSDRVPFGTGRAIAKIEALWSEGKEYEVYQPALFDELREWLKAIDDLSEGGDWKKVTGEFREPLIQSLLKMGAAEQHERILRTRKSEDDRRRDWHTWFDGFATLKLVHALRDAGFPNTALAAIAVRPQESQSESGPYLS